MHLWDLRTAAGLTLAAEPELWADTVDEVVTVMQPRQVRLDRMPRLVRPIALTATDVDRAWRLDCEQPDGAPAVEVRGPASALALLLWRRTSTDDPALAVTGGRSVLDGALAQRLTP